MLYEYDNAALIRNIICCDSLSGEDANTGEPIDIGIDENAKLSIRVSTSNESGCATTIFSDVKSIAVYDVGLTAADLQSKWVSFNNTCIDEENGNIDSMVDYITAKSDSDGITLGQLIEFASRESVKNYIGVDGIEHNIDLDVYLDIYRSLNMSFCITDASYSCDPDNADNTPIVTLIYDHSVLEEYYKNHPIDNE